MNTHPAAPPRQGLVIVNLGTPAAATAGAVRSYLREFLSDRRVVQIPHWLWKPLLNGIILPRRAPAVAEKYAEIWLPDGSPLWVHTRDLAQAIAAQWPHWQVLPAMRYGQPSLPQAVQALAARGVQQAWVLPLYPQYSTTTTASVEDVLQQVQAAFPALALHHVRDYHDHPAWANAVAGRIRQHWAQQGRGERLLFSYHGIPERLVRQGDPYAAQCEASTRAIAAALGVAREEILLTYQSRFGRERWLQPYTQQTLEALGREGVQDVDVVCPGFAVDCLETLEEIALQNAEAFRHAGGGELRYVPCLNAGADHAAALAAVVNDAAGDTRDAA